MTTLLLFPALALAPASNPPALFDRSAWFLLPAFAAGVFMVLAMIECLAAFIASQPRRKNPSNRAAVMERLLALNGEGQPYRLASAPPADLEVIFDPVDPSWRARFARVKLTTHYRARLLLDEERHQVRWFEVLRSSSFFVGFQNLRPRLGRGIWVWAGYFDVQWTGMAYGMRPGFLPRIVEAVRFRLDTVALKREIRAVASRAGWGFRPKVWWFQVRRRRDGTIPRGLIPSETRYWTERQFWGVVYPLFYLLTIGYIVVAASGWKALRTWDTLLPVLGFSAFWWSIWGGIMTVFWLVDRRTRQSVKRGPA